MHSHIDSAIVMNVFPDSNLEQTDSTLSTQNFQEGGE